MNISLPPPEYFPLLAMTFSVGCAVGIAVFNWYISRRNRREDLRLKEQQYQAEYAGKVASSIVTLNTGLLEVELLFVTPMKETLLKGAPPDWLPKASKASEPLAALSAISFSYAHPFKDRMLDTLNQYADCVGKARSVDELLRKLFERARSEKLTAAPDSFKSEYAELLGQLQDSLEKTREALALLHSAAVTSPIASDSPQSRLSQRLSRVTRLCKIFRIRSRSLPTS